ncbi:MAG TPA: AIR synthase-related protein, partial [Mesotoga sp.]|nr:AIR synthase-related protein [Mesotoga sp.]
YDLAGFSVGLVDRQEIIDGSTIENRDILIGWPSSGFHSNGFSLVRKILSDEKINLHETVPGIARPIGLELLTPTRIYVSLFERLKGLCKPKGIAHITGGGLLENVPRVIPKGLKCEIHTDSWEVPPLIEFIVERGSVETREAYRTFNMGLGLVTVVSPDEVDAVMHGMKDEKPVEIGAVVAGEGGVTLCRRG